MHTLTRNTLRELICDAVRGHRGDAPYDLTDQILAVIKVYAPKSFVENDIDFSDSAKYAKVAEELIKSKAFDIDRWEINAFKPNFTEEEISMVDDLIGAASVTVSF